MLGRYPAIARPSSEPESLGGAGGLSGSRLWRYPSGLGTLLARAWPADGPPRSALEEIHGWLGESADLGFIPAPLRGLDGRTLYGHAGRLWEVTPWLPGTAEAGHPPPADRVRAAFVALAAFHQRLSRHQSAGPSPGLQARLKELTGWLGSGFSAVETLLALRRDDPLCDAARRWVEAARARAPYAVDGLTRGAGVTVVRQPCLRDVRPEHVLFTGGTVTGLVDFGAMGVDTVAADLARLLSEWTLGTPSARNAALAAYESVRPLAPEETALIEVFERSSAVLVGGHWVRWHFVEGRVFDDPAAVARGLAKGLERLTETGAGRIEGVC